MVKKVTFTLDDTTIRRIESAAARLDKARSAVVREAIADYHERIGRLSEIERQILLSAFDRLVPAIPRRPASEVKREIAALRTARRAGGRGRR